MNEFGVKIEPFSDSKNPDPIESTVRKINEKFIKLNLNLKV